MSIQRKHLTLPTAPPLFPATFMPLLFTYSAAKQFPIPGVYLLTFINVIDSSPAFMGMRSDFSNYFYKSIRDNEKA